MKLQDVNKTNYNVTDELMEFTVDRFILEMNEATINIIPSCYTLNESTDVFELNEAKLEEAFKDILKVGAQKFGKLFKNLKGASDEIIQRAAADVQSRMATSGKEGLGAKIGAFAKKNAKFAKPAMIVAVLGASLLGMDTASANEVISGLDNMGGPELDAAMADYGLDPAGAGEAAGGVGAPTEAINALKIDIAREFVDSKLPSGATIPKDVVLDAIKTGKFDGMSLDQYLSKAVEFADKRGLNPQELRRIINPEIQQGMMDALSGKV